MPELVNSNLVNVIENDIPAYLNWYDDKTTWLNTQANGVYFNPDMSYTFANAINMNLGMSDEWLGYFSFVNNMSHMAYDCRNLRGNPAVPPRVQNMNAAFWNCVNLNKANVGQSVTDYNQAFFHCNNITQIDIGIVNADNFGQIAFTDGYYNTQGGHGTDLSNVKKVVVSGAVTSMAYAFNNYRNLYGSPNCGMNVINMYYAYSNSGVIGVPVIGNNVINASHAYENAKGITGDIWCGKNTQDLSYAFSNAINIWGNVNTGNHVSNMASAFAYCKNLKGNVYIGRNVKNMSGAFYYCQNITNYLISPPNINNIVDLNSAFFACRGIKGSPICSANAIGMGSAYQSCSNLTGEIWVGSKIETIGDVAAYCYNLQYININKQNLTHLANANCAFEYCHNARGIAGLGADPTKAVSFYSMYTGCNNIQYIDVNEEWAKDVNKPTTNCVYAFWNCSNMVGNAVIPAQQSMDTSLIRSMYGNCNSLTGIVVYPQNSNQIANIVFGNNDNTTNLSKVTDIYLGDTIINAHDAFRAHNTIFGKVNHEVDGLMGNNMQRAQGMFSYCNNITGDGYVPDSVNVNQNFAYEYARSIDGTAYFSSGVKDSIDTRMSFVGCNKITNIEYGTQSGWLGISRAFTSWLADNNGSAGHSHTNMSNVQYINIKDSCNNIGAFMDGAQCQLGGNEADSFTGIMIGANNAVNATLAFRRCHNYAKNVANKTGICPPKVQNARAMYQACWYLENAQCTNVVKDAGYMYYDCRNLNCNLQLGTGLTDSAYMYGNCQNLGGQIPMYFGLCNDRNTAYMFVNCYNLDENSPLVVPCGVTNFDNMFYGLQNKNFKKIYYFGHPTSPPLTYTGFGSTQALSWPASDNIKEVYFMNTFDAVAWTNSNAATYPGISKRYKIEWYTGVQSFYINMVQAAYFFQADGGMIGNNGDRNLWRSNNFNNLHNIYIQDHCENMTRFAHEIPQLKANVIHINYDTSNMTDMTFAFGGCRNLTDVTGFNVPKNVKNIYYMFAACKNLYMNMSNVLCGDNVSQMAMAFYQCQNIYGEPFSSANCVNMVQTYLDCYNLTGNPAIGNNVTNCCLVYQNCYNLNGNPVMSPVSTNAAQAYYRCMNMVGSPAFSNVNGCNYRQTYYDCHNLTFFDPVQEKKFATHTVSNVENMCYNCSNMIGTAPIKRSWGTWWNVYYNCRNITGLNFYGVPAGYSLAGMFNVIFGKAVMNAINIRSANFLNEGDGVTSDQQGADLWDMFWLENVYFDMPNSAHGLHFGGCTAYNFDAAKAGTVDRTGEYASKVHNFENLNNIVLGPNVVNASGFAVNLRSKPGRWQIDMYNAVNIVNATDFATFAYNLSGNVYLYNKLTQLYASFERTNIDYAHVSETTGNLFAAYAFSQCFNLKGTVYMPFRTTNSFRYYYQDANVEQIWIRGTSNWWNCAEGCNNVKIIHLDNSVLGTSLQPVFQAAFGYNNTNLSNVTTIDCSGNITGSTINLFRGCPTLRCQPNICENSDNIAYSYYACPNIDPNIGNMFVNRSKSILGLFASTTPPVHGNIYLNVNVSSGCDYTNWLNPSRTSSTPRLNVFWRRDSHWDNATKSPATSTGLAWGTTGQKFIFEVADNGWFSPSTNIYIYNNYNGIP